MEEVSIDEAYEAYDVIGIRREECHKTIRDYNTTEGSPKMPT